VYDRAQMWDYLSYARNIAAELDEESKASAKAAEARLDELEKDANRRLAKIEHSIALLFGAAAWFWFVKPAIEPKIDALPYDHSITGALYLLALFVTVYGVSYVWRRTRT
jgi:hypothetical protein